MKHSPLAIALILASSLATGAMAMALTDQTAAKAPTKQTTPTTAVKITGCLEPQAAPAAPAAKPVAALYKLTNLTADDWKAATSTSGTMLGSTDLTTLREVQVKANSGVNLKPHEGHKVELTGKLSQSSKAAASDINGPVLQVSSLKMIATSCQ